MLGAPIHRQPSEFPPYVNAANGWSSFAFYRDPVDRFLSAWIHGCDGDHLSCRSVMDGEEAGKCIACLHALGSDPLSLTTLEEKVDAFERAVREALPAYMELLNQQGYVSDEYDPHSLMCHGGYMENFSLLGNLSLSYDQVFAQVTDICLAASALAKQLRSRVYILERLEAQR